MYKPRGQMRGEGVAQMTTILNKSYLVKVSAAMGEGHTLSPNFFGRSSDENEKVLGFFLARLWTKKKKINRVVE